MRNIFLVLLSLGGAAQACLGGARHFTTIYEAPTNAPGSIEFENHVVGRFAAGLNEVAFRHEIEIGLTPRLQLGIYLANWETARHGPTRYDSSSLEAIYNLTNPVTDFVGLSLYQEITGGRRVFASETKLIAQRNFGPLIVAYNFSVEATWGGESLREQDGEISQALGASYEITPRLSLGVELLHEIVLPEWDRQTGNQNFFLGPNLSLRGNGWFSTLTFLVQATSTADEPAAEARLIFGLDL